MTKKEIILDELKKKTPKGEIIEKHNVKNRYVNKIIQEEKINTELFKNHATIQKLRDIQRIERKIKREDFRKNNSSDKYLSEIVKQLKGFKLLELKTYEKENKKEEFEGIFQLSDLHFNEIISDLTENSYDFTIASKRLKKYVTEATKIFKVYGVKKLLVAMTGDILGSDRRVDERLSQATNRSKATIIGMFLLEQVIRELNVNFDIKITMVCGNESRVYESGNTDIVFSDNYDFMMYYFLKIIFRNNLTMFFDPENENIYKKIININGKNILFLHGHNISKNTEIDVIKLTGQIAALSDITLDYVIFGHIHNCQISDFYARSSSLSGGNAYSANQLKLASRSSQNIHLVSKKSIMSMKIDLQDVNGVTGYPVNNNFDIISSVPQRKKLIYDF